MPLVSCADTGTAQPYARSFDFESQMIGFPEVLVGSNGHNVG